MIAAQFLPQLRALSTRQKGFSLAEVIITLFLAGIAVLVISNIPNAISIISGSQNESKVREVVAKKIEDTRLTGFDNLSIGSAPINDPRLTGLSNVSAFMIVSDCPLSVCPSGEEIKEVKFSVSWNENGSTKLYQLTTLVGKGGLK